MEENRGRRALGKGPQRIHQIAGRLVRLDDDLVQGREARQQHAIIGRLLPRRQPGEGSGGQRLEEQRNSSAAALAEAGGQAQSR